MSDGEAPADPRFPTEEEKVEEELSMSRGEVSHSPLSVSAARKKFQDAENGEVEEKRPAAGGAAKGPALPRCQGGKYKYDDLKMPGSRLTKEQIDITQREDYLSREEFEKYLETTPEEFAKLPKWKKEQMKKKVGLF
eukprot:TRINITY_DN31305_c0_g1_i1.p1 TRINITY_DN31305_c0_g1~~TRINITY_DN31305_c0_g1_i1.p1  ORF type:complete len:152 (+),score=37.70 TRINITY_DN31305_c0_g1_i1:46-456(+)